MKTLIKPELARKRISKRIAEGAELAFYATNEGQVEPWRVAVQQTLEDIFGSDGRLIERYSYRHIALPDLSVEQDHANSVNVAVERLRTLESMLDEAEEVSPDLGLGSAESRRKEPRPLTGRVFVVHGRDVGRAHEVARFLESLKLHPIILAEQANEGRTIIEKFEQFADVDFAVVILTADDEGSLRGSPEVSLRARQNVILELGYFIGALDRSRVSALYFEGVELPSDIHGVAYILFDQNEGWKAKLLRELQASGVHKPS